MSDRLEAPYGAAPLLVGVREAAVALALGRDSCYELVRTGRIRAVRVNRKILIPRSELAAFIERETHPPPNDEGRAHETRPPN